MNEDKMREIEQRLETIEARNKRVELAKAWETSWTRKVGIAIVTYVTICLFFIVRNDSQAFIDALVPTTGFLLSTLSLSAIKDYWLKHQK